MTDLTSLASRKALAKMLMRLFDLWELDEAEQATLLGYSSTDFAVIQSYRNGKPLENKNDLLVRAGVLLGIHKALRLIFPYNRDMAYRWIKSTNRHFDNRRPLDVMLNDGCREIRNYLDHACE